MPRRPSSSKKIPAYDPAYKAVVDALVAARHKAGIRQEDLAAAIGRPQSAISKFERLDKTLDVMELIELAEAIGVDARKLLQVGVLAYRQKAKG